ncbi:hypothetical protein niasHT_026455 [Heterodera trifolii]|uniref:Protein orai n=1 Tax=Heterodera trifolii TaxID=157864 RepID=A0ABD2KJA1_9BILA
MLPNSFCTPQKAQSADAGPNRRQFGHLPWRSPAERGAAFGGRAPWPSLAHYQDDHQRRKKSYRRQNQNHLREEMQFYKASDRRKIHPFSVYSLKDQREQSIGGALENNRLVTALGMHRKTMLRQSMSEQNLAKFARNSIYQQQQMNFAPANSNGGGDRCLNCAHSNGHSNGKVSAPPHRPSVPHGSVLSSVSSSSTMVAPNSNHQSNGESAQQRNPSNGTTAGGRTPRHSLKNGGTANGAPPQGYPQSLVHLHRLHRGELSIHEKYRYDLSRAQLKASSRTSALLAGFAMIALVELQYQESTPKPLLIMLGVVTSLLVSVHLLALMMSTCLLPYIEANGCTQDSPHIKLRFYIELSWLFSTCIGLLLFLLEIGVIFFVKFNSIGYTFAAYITTGMLVPVVIVFIIISYLIHRNRFTHSIDRVNDKVSDLQKYLYESELNASAPQKSNSVHRNLANAGGLQGVTVVRNVRD